MCFFKIQEHPKFFKEEAASIPKKVIKLVK